MPLTDQQKQAIDNQKKRDPMLGSRTIAELLVFPYSQVNNYLAREWKQKQPAQITPSKEQKETVELLAGVVEKIESQQNDAEAEMQSVQSNLTIFSNKKHTCKKKSLTSIAQFAEIEQIIVLFREDYEMNEYLKEMLERIRNATINNTVLGRVEAAQIRLSVDIALAKSTIRKNHISNVATICATISACHDKGLESIGEPSKEITEQSTNPCTELVKITTVT